MEILMAKILKSGKIFAALLMIPGFTFAQRQEIVGYFPGGGMRNNYYNAKNIETSGSADKLTVIDYAFCEPKPDSLGRIVPTFSSPLYAFQQPCTAQFSIDGVGDDSSQALRGNFNQLRKLKARHPHLKILISIGGWGGSTYFSDAALTKESREFFVDSCISMFIKGNLPVVNGAGGKAAAAGIFDGIDIDWEFPISGGNTGVHYNAKDNDNLSELFKLFRKKLDEIDPKLLLTAALPAQSSNVKNFNVAEDSKILDWFTLMTYDLYGGWDTTTGHHTNLLTSSDEPPIHPEKLSLDRTVKLFHDKYGVPYNKLLGGAAFYGRGWSQVDSTNNGLYQKGKVGGGGYGGYRHLVQLENEGYKLYWDKSTLSHWLYNPQEKIFWSFDDPQSIALKARYCNAHHLRGIMFWELSGDDDNGTLVNTIYTMNMPNVQIKKTREGKNKIRFSVTNPAQGDYYVEGSDVRINTDLTNNDRSIGKVEFFVDNISVGFVTKGNFDWAWFNASKGEHLIKAIAEDSSGILSESAPVKIFVNSSEKCTTIWQPGKTYRTNEQVIYNGKIYVCVKTHTLSYGANTPDSGTEFWKPLNGIDQE